MLLYADVEISFLAARVLLHGVFLLPKYLHLLSDATIVYLGRNPYKKAKAFADDLLIIFLTTWVESTWFRYQFYGRKSNFHALVKPYARPL